MLEIKLLEMCAGFQRMGTSALLRARLRGQRRVRPE
jgi:hypothetical protein